jgi:hypothetical protein
MSSQRVSKDKLLWSSDPGDLAIAPFLVVDGSKRIDHRLIGTDLDSDLYRSQLPSRIVLIDNDTSQQASNAPFPPVLRVGGLSIPNLDADQWDQEKFILILYDRWIENLIERRKLNRKIGVSIYFEDLTKAQAWEEAFKNKNNYPPWASDLKFPTPPPRRGDVLDVNVWRHISITKVLEWQRNPLFYEMTSYHNAFFSFLYAVDPKADRNEGLTALSSGGSPPSFHAQYLLRQLVESALLRVLVIDDRVAGTIWGSQDADQKIKALRYMGIFIARKITVDDQKEPIILAGDQQESARGWVNLHLQENGSIKSIEIDSGEDSGPTPLEFDVLFIHQTIFENKIAPSRKEKQEKNEWVFNLKKKIPYVIFHSGRGKQPELLPENAAFLEYSALQEHLLQEPSKFLLTQIALSAKG